MIKEDEIRILANDVKLKMKEVKRVSDCKALAAAYDIGEDKILLLNMFTGIEYNAKEAPENFRFTSITIDAGILGHIDGAVYFIDEDKLQFNIYDKSVDECYDILEEITVDDLHENYEWLVEKLKKEKGSKKQPKSRTYYTLRTGKFPEEEYLLDGDGNIKEFDTYEEAYDAMCNCYIKSLGSKYFTYVENPIRYRIFETKISYYQGRENSMTQQV